jgi:aspartyl-tRNA(Asn)/glutamyl-tRNA(Gln) amidotransferase subunit A
MIYVEDSIMQKGLPAAAGSKILENFIAPFDAEVITRLNEKTERVKLSEFGMGEPGELPSPLLCNDIFGHIRRQADKQGLCYIRPEYGTVSRYGLIPAACSMDQIGIVAANPAEGFALLEKITGCDSKDGAMQYESARRASGDVTPRRVNITPAYADMQNQVLHILAYAEFSNNISRYDGIKFGFRSQSAKNLESLYTNTRTEGFGLDAKLTAIMGAFVITKKR